MRTCITETMQYPYSAIGMLAMRFKDQNKNQDYFGTGFLVGPNIVLTCAHNCYSVFHGKAREITFYPALNGLKGESFEVKKIYYS